MFHLLEIIKCTKIEERIQMYEMWDNCMFLVQSK